MNNVEYKMDTFPTSENFWVFGVFGGCIYQVISPEAYNIDTGEVEWFEMVFDDPVTAEIMCNMLNDEIGEV